MPLRALTGSYVAVEQSFVVKKGDTANAAMLDRFVDELRASGFIRASLDRAQLASVGRGAGTAQMSADDPAPADLISRRALLGRVGAAGAFAALPEMLAPAAGAAAAQTPRPIAREPLETLTPSEADVLEAITARLIPSDATSPGAAEARAAHYIDRALGGALASFRDTYRAGLASVDAFARASRGAAFAQLPVVRSGRGAGRDGAR